MRDAFIKELYDIAQEDDRVLLMSGDIGFKVFDRFRDDFKGRFFNMGIAEANMIGVSAGMAMSGKRPVVYTIIPFLTMRAFEQIRVDLAMHNLPVLIVGVGGGLAYDMLGPTHHSIEDVSLMRSLPNMTVLVPSDPHETRQVTRAAHEHDGPVYIRLGKNGEPALRNSYDNFEIGKACLIRPGDDVLLVGAGPILSVAISTADHLSEMGVSCAILNVASIKPFDQLAVIEAAKGKRCVLSIEEHSTIGGVGSAVCETIAEAGIGVKVKRIGIDDKFTVEVGSQSYLLNQHGINVRAITDTIQTLI